MGWRVVEDTSGIVRGRELTWGVGVGWRVVEDTTRIVRGRELTWGVGAGWRVVEDTTRMVRGRELTWGVGAGWRVVDDRFLHLPAFLSLGQVVQSPPLHKRLQLTTRIVHQRKQLKQQVSESESKI